MSDRYSVLGMTCGGCATSVTNAIQGVAQDAEVSVDLETKTITVSNADAKTVEQAVIDAGFEFKGSV